MKKLLFLFALGLPIAAGGQPTPSTPQANPDANDMICRNIREIGSRLNMRRVCMTRQEWAEQRRETRQNIERAQTWRPGATGQ